MSGHMGAILKDSYCKYLFVLVGLQSSAIINLILELHNFKLMQVCIWNKGHNYSNMVPQKGTKYRSILALEYCNAWSVGLQVYRCKVAMYSQYRFINHWILSWDTIQKQQKEYTNPHFLQTA